MARGVLVLEERLEGAEAHLLRTTGKGVMRVKAALPELGRKRFAIAHELGHWELHAHFLHGMVCTDMDMLNSSVSPPETRPIRLPPNSSWRRHSSVRAVPMPNRT